MSLEENTRTFTAGRLFAGKIYRITGRVVIYLILVIFLLIFAFPYYFMIVGSTFGPGEIFEQPPKIFFGDSLFDNFILLFQKVPLFYMAFINSVLIATLGTTLKVFFNAMAGFAFSKFEFKGKRFFFGIVLTTMLMPHFVNIIPFYKMMTTFGWINTYWPFLIPGLTSAFGIILMRQYIQNSIPTDILDAARIDGVGEFRMIFMIVIPLIRPAIAVLGTITFIGHWNDFMGALLFLTDEKMFTLPIALRAMVPAMERIGGHGAIALSNSLASLPLLGVFIFFSKQIINNLTAGSIKG
ncbi:MAG: carbohydrate ABC transporter permease [Spirochaetales bacterium]|nr:carbohydrate ABC transporter permease [Spirochaetales bacterium]